MWKVIHPVHLLTAAMPRKAFVADLQEATKLFERVNVSNLKAGEEDGMINFLYHISDGDATEITAMVPGR